MNKRISLLGLILCFIGLKSMATVVYVDSAHVSFMQSGTSWLTAYPDLQTGINEANAGDTVWVAKGTYKPPLNYAFYMKEGVKILGGFLNTDTSILQRNWQINSTILEGNGHRVIENQQNGLTGTSVLDGFNVLHGNSLLQSNWDGNGGGVYNVNVSPTFRHCSFTSNSANFGGCFYNSFGSPTIDSCYFNGNIYLNRGGAIYNYYSSPIIKQCMFENHIGFGANGAAIYNESSSPLIIQCSFSNNKTRFSYGAAIFNYGVDSANALVTISNCSFTNNEAEEGTIYNSQSEVAVHVIGCTFTNNTAVYRGGAICSYNNRISIDSSTFNSNKTTDVGSFANGFGDGGGAFFCYGGAQGISIKRSSFFNNTTNSRGGALNLYNSDTATISDCNFTADSSMYLGGAICCEKILLRNAVFNKNVSMNGGGALECEFGGGNINNCLFTKNTSARGAAIDGGNFKINNCTITQNINTGQWGVIYASFKMSNTILWGNNVGISSLGALGPNITYSLIQDYSANTSLHVLDGTTNPLFVDTSGVGDYHLQALSPCINNGQNDSFPSDIYVDIEHNPRISGGVIDMGVYEFPLPPVIHLNADTNICLGDTITLNAQNYGCSYLWNTGDTTQTIHVFTSGNYYVTVTNMLGSSSDTIEITVKAVPIVDLGNDTTVNGNSYVLDAGSGAMSYLWNTGATSQTIILNAGAGGVYSVNVTNSFGCSSSDTVSVSFQPTGIQEIVTSANGLTVTPNPTKEFIFINIRDMKLLNTRAILMDTYGHIIRSTMMKSKSQPFSLAGLASGIYILKMENGVAIKIVKE